MLHLATSVARPNLVSLGTCFGKFSKTGKFKLGIMCLDYLAKYAKYKVRLYFHLPSLFQSLFPLSLIPRPTSLVSRYGLSPGLVGFRIWCRVLSVTGTGTDEKTCAILV